MQLKSGYQQGMAIVKWQDGCCLGRQGLTGDLLAMEITGVTLNGIW